MIKLFECSDEAFLRIIRACASYYDDGDGWETMFGEDASDEDILNDRGEAIHCAIALMEAMGS